MKDVARKLVRLLFDCLTPIMQARVIALRSTSGRPSLGRGVFIHRSVQMLGKAFVSIGANSVLSQDCWLNVNHRTGNMVAIELGANCFIGRRNFFSSGRRIEFGDYVLTANDCHFLGSSHVVDDPLRPYLIAGTTDTDIIIVGHNTFIGAGTCVLGNISIGHGCVIGSSSLVTSNIPPFSIAAGSPATVRKRYSFVTQKWILLADFTADDENSLPDSAAYQEELSKHPAPRMPYLAAGNDMGQC